MGEKYVGDKSVGEKYVGKIGVGGMLAFVSPLLRFVFVQVCKRL